MNHIQISSLHSFSSVGAFGGEALVIVLNPLAS